MIDMFNPELDSGTEDVMVDIVSAEIRSGTEDVYKRQGLEKVSSHSKGYESKTIGRQQSGMQFSPPEPRNDPERSFH